MDVIASFLTVVDSFCAARGISESRASTIVLNGGGRISAIRAGTSDIGARRLAEAMQWLSDNWPEGARWPSGVTRPAPATKSMAASVATLQPLRSVADDPVGEDVCPRPNGLGDCLSASRS